MCVDTGDIVEKELIRISSKELLIHEEGNEYYLTLILSKVRGSSL